ncbi:alanine racemase [Fusibacter bizertensis]
MRGTRVEVDLTALSHNYTAMRALIPESVKIAGIVKANAYGHDLVSVAKKLENLGVDYLGVANIYEAKMLRKNEIVCPILVMGKTFEEDYDIAVKHDITLTIFDLEDARKLNLNASYDNKVAKIHIKFDSGFNRLGYKEMSKLIEDVMEIRSYEFIEIEGIFTHLALKDVSSDDEQFDKFDELLKKLKELQLHIPIKHACDSIGAVAYPNKHYNMVRLGAILYGYCSRKTTFELKPVMSFKTNISQVKRLEIGEGVGYDYLFVAERKTTVAVLPVGYADGLPRNLSNMGFVVINGQMAPIIGLLCMDQCMVDVTELSTVNVGDEVVLFDEQAPTLSEVAKIAKTNRNEILSRIALRVPRLIFDEQNVIRIDYMEKL